ncbi:MAG: hypothetical protein ACUVQY_03955 [Thermoproteota archaeon]
MGRGVLEKMKKALRERKEELREKYGVKEIDIFGPCVRGRTEALPV